jgi:phospholipid/cholesterol/gamma-HCH transport system ATP-binding protein
VIIELSGRLQCTTVTITHDMESAFRIGDRIAMLDRGKIVAEAPPEEFRRLADPRVQQFIHGTAEGPLTAPDSPSTGKSPDREARTTGGAAGPRAL